MPKPAGWTAAELVDIADTNATTFRRIRAKAGLKASPKGGKGAQRRYSRADVASLIDAAVSPDGSQFRYGRDVAEKWHALLK